MYKTLTQFLNNCDNVSEIVNYDFKNELGKSYEECISLRRDWLESNEDVQNLKKLYPFFDKYLDFVLTEIYNVVIESKLYGKL